MHIYFTNNIFNMDENVTDNTDISDTIYKEKKDMLKKIFKLYPNLKTDQKKIMEECIKKKSTNDTEE